ncbi:MAG: hypothetical protein V4667_01495 [Bacteroidota bacterium]
MTFPIRNGLPDFKEDPNGKINSSKKQPSKFYLVLDKGFFTPLNNYVIYPIKKLVKEFSVNKYVVMFIVAFIAVMILVIAGYPVWDFFD